MVEVQHIGAALVLVAMGLALLSRTRSGEMIAVLLAVFLAAAIIVHFLEVAWVTGRL